MLEATFEARAPRSPAQVDWRLGRRHRHEDHHDRGLKGAHESRKQRHIRGATRLTSLPPIHDVGAHACPSAIYEIDVPRTHRIKPACLFAARRSASACTLPSTLRRRRRAHRSSGSPVGTPFWTSKRGSGHCTDALGMMALASNSLETMGGTLVMSADPSSLFLYSHHVRRT
jgi:hypothetical protein